MNYKMAMNLSELMKRRGVSQRELARMLGVSAPAVSAWQRGIRSVPAVRVDAICEALECRRSELLDGPSSVNISGGSLVIEIAGRDFSAAPFILPGDRIYVRRLERYQLERGALCAYSIEGKRPSAAYIYETADGLLVSPINRPAFRAFVVSPSDLEIIGIVKKITRSVRGRMFDV